MDKNNFDTRFNKVKKDAQLFKRLTQWMLGANILLILTLMTTINKEKIVLVPQVAPEDKLWVTNSQVSNEYLSILSRNLTSLLLDVSPVNVKAQHAELLKFVAADYTDLMKAKLDDIGKVITENNISQNFFINNIKIIHGKNVVYLNGTLNEYIDKSLSSSTGQIYKLTFKVKNYSTQLTNFELIKAGDPQLKDLGL